MIWGALLNSRVRLAAAPPGITGAVRLASVELLEDRDHDDQHRSRGARE
jgi:hypothetical protein